MVKSINLISLKSLFEFLNFFKLLRRLLDWSFLALRNLGGLNRHMVIAIVPPVGLFRFDFTDIKFGLSFKIQVKLFIYNLLRLLHFGRLRPIVLQIRCIINQKPLFFNYLLLPL